MVEEHRAGLLLREAGDHVQQRRLPRAVRADEPDHLAGSHRERDVVDRDDATEPNRDALHLQLDTPGPRRGRDLDRPLGDVVLHRLEEASEPLGDERGRSVGRPTQQLDHPDAH